MPELDCDMTPKDLAYILRRLRFADEFELVAISIDREVRNYLVEMLQA